MARHATDAAPDTRRACPPRVRAHLAPETVPAPRPAVSHVNGYRAPETAETPADGFTYRHGVAL